jgi:starvation-inducible DNA-binding protein
MTTQAHLEQVFCDNFVAYFRSHVAHVNIMGRNFHSDHELLGGIYEDLQAQIDIIAELLRSIGAFMPDSLDVVIEASHVNASAITGNSEDLLADVRNDLDQLKACYEELMVVANDEKHEEIGNYAQDRILALAKFIWMLDSTLG